MTFITKEEVIRLTGKIYPKCQIKWLDEHKYIYEHSGSGEPLIHADYIAWRMGAPKDRIRKKTVPNYTSIKQNG